MFFLELVFVFSPQGHDRAHIHFVESGQHGRGILGFDEAAGDGLAEVAHLLAAVGAGEEFFAGGAAGMGEGFEDVVLQDFAVGAGGGDGGGVDFLIRDDGGGDGGSFDIVAGRGCGCGCGRFCRFWGFNHCRSRLVGRGRGLGGGYPFRAGGVLVDPCEHVADLHRCSLLPYCIECPGLFGIDLKGCLFALELGDHFIPFNILSLLFQPFDQGHFANGLTNCRYFNIDHVFI